MMNVALLTMIAFGWSTGGPADAGGDLAAAYQVATAAATQADPADSLYRAARETLSRGDYRQAADLFHRVRDRYPSSGYAGDALYYEAFALYRSGRTEDLQAARQRLSQLGERYPEVSRRSDAPALDMRICGVLAKQGDADCAEVINRQARDPEDPQRGAGRAERDAQRAQREIEKTQREIEKTQRKTERGRGTGASSDTCARGDDEDDTRIAALNALLQMDAERAMPILKKVLARRDACSAGLRQKAVFLVSQKRSAETAQLLLDVVRTDPDAEVRGQAVFWLSQVPGDETVDMLENLLKTSKDDDIQEKALFALSQHRGGRSAQLLRDYAQREDVSGDLREKAVFWLGQQRSEENAQFLKQLYGRIRSEEVREKILFSLSQMRGFANDRWLLDVATDTAQSVELRKKALFWAGQGGAPIEQLVGLYARMPDTELREQLIFVYSQRREPAAVDKLLDVARNEKDPELRKKAIFWLGQSRDPRVAQFLQELIDR